MIAPPAMLGVLGGGQLGRYFTFAAHRLGYSVTVLDPDPASPAGSVAERHLRAAYDDLKALDELARSCAAVSIEFENVPAATLERLAGAVRVAPAATCVHIAQDRIREKRFFEAHGVPVGAYRAIETLADLQAAREFPGVLKLARFGYDGKGQRRVVDAAEAREAWQALAGKPCVLETLLPLDCEISVVLTRAEDGAARVFPIAENRHRHGILDVTIAPARIAPALATDAIRVATRIAERLAYVGTLGVELFVSGGRVLANEIAPRPHNSGHYTIDACQVDQFEQQVRALTGLPLAEPQLLAPAVMVNLLGELWSDGAPDWTAVLAAPGAALHLYGKREPRPGRKMGHFTVLDSDPSKALERALELRAALGVRDD